MTTSPTTTTEIPNNPRPAKRHEAKIWVQPFNDLQAGIKRADARRCDDRDFRRGDELLEREYVASSSYYTGRAILCRITHITRFAGELPLCAIQIDEERGTSKTVQLAVLSIEVLQVGTYEQLAATKVIG